MKIGFACDSCGRTFDSWPPPNNDWVTVRRGHRPWLHYCSTECHKAGYTLHEGDIKEAIEWVASNKRRNL